MKIRMNYRKLLRPNIDGVVIRDGMQPGYFPTPSMGENPNPEDFLEQLCMKMGSPADLWRRKKLEVIIYQVEGISRIVYGSVRLIFQSSSPKSNSGPID